MQMYVAEMLVKSFERQANEFLKVTRDLLSELKKIELSVRIIACDAQNRELESIEKSGVEPQ
jgi:hypothetical protein